MKYFFEALISIVLAIFLLSALPASGEEQIYEGVVRLHVLADSDTAKAQAAKIKARDAILEKYGELLSTLQTAEEARLVLGEALPEIEKTVAEAVGDEVTVKASLTEEYFDTRAYGEITLPAGTYTSLTVTIGEGEGQNWWCILFPSMCTAAALGDTVSEEELALSPSEYRLVTDTGYILRFRTLEILESVFG